MFGECVAQIKGRCVGGEDVDLVGRRCGDPVCDVVEILVDVLLVQRKSGDLEAGESSATRMPERNTGRPWVI